MREELKTFRRLCKKARVNPKKVREFFRVLPNGREGTESEVNNYIEFAMQVDTKMVVDAIKQERKK